jgi:hypothetical protein
MSESTTEDKPDSQTDVTRARTLSTNAGTMQHGGATKQLLVDLVASFDIAYEKTSTDVKPGHAIYLIEHVARSDIEEDEQCRICLQRFLVRPPYTPAILLSTVFSKEFESVCSALPLSRQISLRMH